MNIKIKLRTKGKPTRYIMAPRSKWRRLYAKLASARAQKYLVRVEYGKDKTNTGTTEMFYNEGEYDNPRDAREALKAFIEP